eukprot:403377138
MGKNKGGDLIEDRVIRNPMDQMRRKLKFKEKEKRKEQREYNKQLIQSKPEHDPLLNHDFSAINQIKAQEASKVLGVPQKQVAYAGSKSGILSSMMPSQYDTNRVYYQEQTQDEITHLSQPGEVQQDAPSWEQIQNNYFRQLQGFGVEQQQQYQYYQQPQIQQNYQQPQLNQNQQQNQYQPPSQHQLNYKPKVQPYERKNNQDKDEIVSRPILYQGENSKQPLTKQPLQFSEGQYQPLTEGQQIQPQIKQQDHKNFQKPKKKQDTFDDPLDPSHGDKNYVKKLQKEKEKQQQQNQQPQTDQDKQEEQKQLPRSNPDQYKGVSADIKKALGLDKIPATQPKQEKSAEDTQAGGEVLENQINNEVANTQVQSIKEQPQIKSKFIPTALRRLGNQAQQKPVQLPDSSLNVQSEPSSKKWGQSKIVQPVVAQIHKLEVVQKIEKPHAQAQPISSLLAGYSDSESEDEQLAINKNNKNNDDILPGQDLMFGGLISQDIASDSKQDMDEELKKFLQAINNQ